MGLQELRQLSKEKVKNIQNNITTADKNLLPSDISSINGSRRRKKIRFEDNFIRFTSYFSQENFKKINMLRDTNEIESVTQLVNDALTQYLAQHY